jgi:hypothetical protein
MTPLPPKRQTIRRSTICSRSGQETSVRNRFAVRGSKYRLDAPPLVSISERPQLSHSPAHELAADAQQGVSGLSRIEGGEVGLSDGAEICVAVEGIQAGALSVVEQAVGTALTLLLLLLLLALPRLYFLLLLLLGLAVLLLLNLRHAVGEVLLLQLLLLDMLIVVLLVLVLVLILVVGLLHLNLFLLDLGVLL